MSQQLAEETEAPNCKRKQEECTMDEQQCCSEQKQQKVMEEDDVFGTERSEFEMVKLFSHSAVPDRVAKVPTAMNEKDLKTIISMVLSEMTELAQTLHPEKDKAVEFVKDCLGVDVKDKVAPKSEVDLIADQADAMVDAIVYLYDRMARMGIDGHEVTKEVAKANMKKGKKTEKGWVFTIRESDGKIMKPDDFVPPNNKIVIQKMIDKCQPK